MLSSCSPIIRTTSLSLVRRRCAAATVGSIRGLIVHEYTSMELLQKYGIKTPKCHVASTPEEAEDIFQNQLNKPGEELKDVIMKAQVLSGHRGPGYFKENGFQGGIHNLTKPGQAQEFAEQMLGKTLVTDLAPQGMLCNKVLLMERLYIRRELFLGIVMDRWTFQGPMLIASPLVDGSKSIAQVAKNNPTQIYTEPIDIMDGMQVEQAERMAYNLGLEEGTNGFQQTVELIQNLYTLFIHCDCSQIEINPLAETPEGDMVVCDAKMSFDDNAAYRQPAIFKQRDPSQEDPREVMAIEHGLNYVGMEGNIGCMVNGAGLSMATMDLIKLKGGTLANFLDVGGGADETQVQMAFEILNGDPSVKAILVNIFGGIMRCDVIASGIIQAAHHVGITKPLVIRLQGSNVDKARTLIEGCGFKMILADDLEDAAEKAVGIAEIAAQAERIHVGVKFDGLGL